VKKLSVVLAMLFFGTSVAVACPGSSSMKDAKADRPVPQQSKPGQSS
jgi:hypothetical protein